MQTRFLTRCVLSLLALLAPVVYAGTTSAILTGVTVVNFTTADSACKTLMDAFALTAGRVLHACSTDPVVVGTSLLFTATATNPRTVNVTAVTAQTSAAPATPYPVAQSPLFQGASTAATSAIASSAVTAVPLTVKDSFGTATPDQYAAMAAVFGSVLGAAAVIWGLKRVHAVLTQPSEA